MDFILFPKIFPLRGGRPNVPRPLSRCKVVCDGITAGSYDVTAMMPGQEGTPYYNMSGRCLGQFTIINGDYSETGSCQFWNAGGDKIFGVYTRKGDPAKAEGNWHMVHGTGKFEGMTSEGKWIPVTNLPPVPNVAGSCSHEWGT